MKISYVIAAILFVFTSCSIDDDTYSTIEGKLERTINGEGIPNQTITVMTRRLRGTGLLSSNIELDSRDVVTDQNGNFSLSLLSESDAFVTIVYQGDDDYYGGGSFRDYPMNEPVIVKTDKLVKFKIYVNNTNPVDENDFVKVEFFAGIPSVRRTGIENFGNDNTSYPLDTSSSGVYEETSWTGTDVNSIIYYSVKETAEDFKIQWNIIKDGVETNGFTDNIPYEINQINPFSFDY